MDLRQLRAFVTVAEELRFTRAAEKLGFAQSTLSAQIRQLEQELGLPVFDRTTRHVSLTVAGERLLIRARSILSEVADVRSEFQLMKGVLSGRVLIGLSQTPGPVDMVSLLAVFSERHPSIELSVREDLSVQLADELREDRLDLGILSIVDEADRRGLAVEPLAEERLVVIVGDHHRLAHRADITIDDLDGERLVASPPGATIRKTVTGAAHAAGIRLDIGFESREASRIRAMVAAGLGVAFLPSSDAAVPGLPIRAIEIEGSSFVHRLSLCWREGRRHSPAAQALLTQAQRTYDNRREPGRQSA